MSRLDWHTNNDRSYETGLDRGVLYPKTKSAVPWNGLMSVDEDGAESADSYYMDGRPFLYLPKPKEFAATIKAYTYPDAFAELMGVAEAADGMFIDSQMGDSFDLSYRTMIGSGASGLESYKLHVIYNAVVSMQGSSYESMSDSVNPSEFSFQIQAVPVPISGYRASAHIIIDSRKVDPSRLIRVENMLYGTDVVSSGQIQDEFDDYFEDFEQTEPTVPTPQELIDILNLGDGITITDNGDGTWTAEGANTNVSQINEDVFELRNADVTVSGNTFTITSN